MLCGKELTSRYMVQHFVIDRFGAEPSCLISRIDFALPGASSSGAMSAANRRRAGFEAEGAASQQLVSGLIVCACLSAIGARPL